MSAAILALDVSGIPQSWLSYDEAISYHAKELVAWSLGEIVAKYHGGIQKDGTHSYIESPSIIAVKGTGFSLNKRKTVHLSNRTLFARDRHICCYCGNRFTYAELSRDHVIPRYHGGLDKWTNVVTSCKPCNQKKDCKTLKKAGMEMLYIPYEPNHYEHLLLQNRNVLGCQMEYLMAGVPKHSRMLSID